MNGKDLAKEAVKDTKSMVNLALEAAKNELIEDLTPSLKKLLEQKFKSKSIKEDVDRLRRAKDGYGETEFEEGKGDKSMDKDQDKEMEESLASFFAPISEEEEDKEVEQEAAEVPVVDEAAACDDDNDKDDKMDEEVEISEESLKAVYEALLQTEVQVKKGFGDIVKGGDFGKDKPNYSGGIADMKSGEHNWDEEEPPAKQDYTVKEAIQRGIAENLMLREQVAKLQETCEQLYNIASKSQKQIKEVNLFNAKLLHTARFLNTHGKLPAAQKKRVMERIEKAKTVSEVKMVYETIVESLSVAKSLTESTDSKKPVANASRPRQSGAAKVLSESVDRTEQGTPSAWSRIQQLAGLKNIK